ncbi:MAG: class I tRNA ligase family protein [Ruminococcus sp.]|jgi:methionyl-tRNA synthetase|nr:class I tRNA ligase family protein [Ruminococcus sp.]
MPYGNKLLHFGHIGGVFVFADVYARFLRDRIGADNVLFVSGTDCYGSPIEESYRKLKDSGYAGSILDFVKANNAEHKKTLARYLISPDIFDGSAIGEAGENHQRYTKEFITTLYKNGHLEKITTKQFFDESAGVFLNGRQVIGKCPVAGCGSSKAYADECDLGHSYLPKDLINPKSTVSGETPVMRDVTNWYYKLPRDLDILRDYVGSVKGEKTTRAVVYKTSAEFLEPPVIFVMNDYRENFDSIAENLKGFEIIEDPKKTSFTVKFTDLADREAAEDVLAAAGIRFRAGKTLVPFRLTGNAAWGLEAPVLEDEPPSTVWVWPESLWAPISFTQTVLKNRGLPPENWREWWCSEDARVYQFIGQDNIYFYCVAEPAMFMGINAPDMHLPREGELQIPTFVANHHILFLDKKASSSGEIKPPMADELLDYYTPEQLRMHFLSLGLGMRSVSFQPKPLNPAAKADESDPVLKEGFLLNNVYNRIVRTCLYEVQKTDGNTLPVGKASAEVANWALEAILEYEQYMYRFEFHQVTYVLDSFIRKISKYMSRMKTETDKSGDEAKRLIWLTDIFYGIKVAQTLLHPIAPEGVELVREYLNLPESIYSWDNVFDELPDIFPNETEHIVKNIPPRFDFFKKHESQLTET